MNYKKVIQLKNEVLKTLKALYYVNNKIKWELIINFLISYIFELKTLSLNALKFIFTMLIISLLLKINNVDLISNNFISNLINFISNLIDFLIKFVLKLNIFK